MRLNAIETSILFFIVLLAQAALGQSTTYPYHYFNGTYNGIGGFRGGFGLLIPILVGIIIVLVVIIIVLVYMLRKKGAKGRK